MTMRDVCYASLYCKNTEVSSRPRPPLSRATKEPMNIVVGLSS